MQHNRKSQNRFYRTKNQLTAMFLLWALCVVALTPGSVLAKTAKLIEGMVYCPLSHKFQPINPPQEKVELKAFNNICADIETKRFLFQEIFTKNFVKQVSLDENKLNDLAFDFLARGKSAVNDVPNSPNLPSENSIKHFGSSITVSSNYEHKLVWNQPIQSFSFSLMARPPTPKSHGFFTLNLTDQLNVISRRIAPRAPPVRS